jgi:hypothetical protein
MKTMLKLLPPGLAAFAAVLGHAQPAATQSLDLQARLKEAKRLDCRFSELATGTWNGGAAKARVSPAAIDVKFQDIDVDGGTAQADSDFGKSFIVVRYSHGYLHLMQMSDAGPLRVTTVFAAESSHGRMKAVQTRLAYTALRLPGYTSRPEMYVGDCAVED